MFSLGNVALHQNGLVIVVLQELLHLVRQIFGSFTFDGVDTHRLG